MIDLDTILDGFEKGEFALEYLPVMCLDNGCCVGAEALLRWDRPTGTVFPDEFIGVTANTPLAGLLTYWVIDRVASELGDWLRSQEGVALHINVPPEILGRGGLEYAAQKSGLNAVRHKIVLEITEHGLPDQMGLRAVDMAARDGVRIAMDDVKIDPANVLILSRCNVQIIKLDKSVLLDLGEGGFPPRWADALAVLLKTTDLDVIAEGVETAEQIALLQAAGVRQVQGYYFSRPLRVEAFLEYYGRHPCVDA
jgi:sensor c-di-GMP phosphodiesterase-like protein